MRESHGGDDVMSDSLGGTVVLTLEHFQGPFFVLILGCMCGGVALLTELSLGLFQSGK